MLQIIVPPTEFYNDKIEEFFKTKELELSLEHSLISLSKWESKWHKPFLVKTPKTSEETSYYIKCMTINKGIDPQTYDLIMFHQNILDDINHYIEDPMTATTFPKEEKKPNREIITSELIYFWMVSYNIPLPCEQWHLNRLLTLINVCSVKNQPKKKISEREILNRQRLLNEQRLKQFNTTG